METFDGNVQVNRYDAEGLRHEMEENGRLVRFIFHKGEAVAEQEENSNVIRLIRGSELIARSSDSESARTYYHYASDEMGSTTHIVDENGSVKNRYAYDAWGRITAQEEAVPNRFTYYGQQIDPITQQYYLRARFYNPVIGRFTQEDTYRGDGLNLYAYCANNPVYYVDPSGYECKAGDKDALHKAHQPADGGGPTNKEETYYFRGTTEGYEGNASLQKIGITPASTDPLVATVFATEAEQYGKGVVYIASSSDLKGVTISEGNVLRDLEREVAIELLPQEFASRASITLSVQTARNILSDMGYSLPSNIFSKGELSVILENMPRLSDVEIKRFVEKARG